MAKVQNSMDSAVGTEDERLLKALTFGSIGKLPIDVEMRLPATSVQKVPKRSKFSKSDGDLTKYYSSRSKNYREEFVESEDYRNARFKLAQHRHRKGGRNKIDDKKQSRRQRRRKSTSSAEKGRKNVDSEQFQIEIDENITVTEGLDLSPRDPHMDPVKTKIKHNSLASYFSNPQMESRQARRSCRSIDTSSTTKTKKQSNSSGQKALSVNELVHNSPWANGVKKSSEPFERRIMRRTPRNSHLRDKMDNHYPSTPSSSGATRKQYKRRSSTDTTALTQSDSGTRNKPRRKYRHSMSGSIDAIPSTSLPLSPKSSGRKTPKPVEVVIDTSNILEPGLVTPYSVSRETKSKSSARSYSDRVMIAAESNRTPMASLKKYLRDEKKESSSETPSTNQGRGETRSFERAPHKSNKVPRNLLQIPFSEELSSTDISEKRDRETHNNRATLSVQKFGKSVAKSMKKQAKNTKRRIGKQISKMAPLKTTKPVTSSASVLVSHIPIDDINHSESPAFKDGVFDSFEKIKDKKGDEASNSPLVALKPPSGLVPYEENDGVPESPLSPLVALKPPSGNLPEEENNAVQQSPNSLLVALKPPSGLHSDQNDDENNSSPISPMAALKPPSGHIPRKESGFQGLDLAIEPHSRKSASRKQISGTVDKSIQPTNPDLSTQITNSVSGQRHAKKSQKKDKSSGNRKSRQRRKSNGKKTTDTASEFPSEKPVLQAVIGGNLNSSLSDLGSSSRSFDVHTSDFNTSSSDQIPSFDYIDEVPEDSTIERSYKINPALHSNGNIATEAYPVIDDEDSTIEHDLKMVSPHPARDLLTVGSFASTSPTPKPETISLSRLGSFGDVHATSERNNSSSISTLTTVPPSPSITQFKGNIDKKDGSEKKFDNCLIDQKCSTINEEGRFPQNTALNKETSEQEANQIPIMSYSQLHDSGSPEEKTGAKANHVLATEKALNKSLKNDSKIEGLQLELVGEKHTENEGVDIEGVLQYLKTQEFTLSAEPSKGLKDEKSKKEKGGKDREEATKKLVEKHQRELERMRRKHEQLMEMNIAFDHDPLAVSEISTTLHTRPVESKSPTKSRRKSMSETHLVEQKSPTKSRRKPKSETNLVEPKSPTKSRRKPKSETNLVELKSPTKSRRKSKSETNLVELKSPTKSRRKPKSETHPVEPKSSTKSGRSSMSESGSGSTEPLSDNGSKEKKSKTHRRGSKTTSRKKQDKAIGGSMTSPKAQAAKGKDDSEASIVKKSNSQILNLRLLLLQSNPEMQPIGFVPAEMAGATTL